MQAYFPKIAWHKLWQKYVIMKKKWKKKRKKKTLLSPLLESRDMFGKYSDSSRSRLDQASKV